MVVATALETVVSARVAPALLALLAAAPANAAMRVLVIAGLGGEPQYEQRFTQWSEKVAMASATVTGDPARVQRLAGQDARRESITAALRDAAQALRSGDRFVLVLLGHGSYDGEEYRFNIAGPDLTGSEVKALLDAIPAGVAQLIVNTTSASGATAERWAGKDRVVVTATKTGGERNATRFGGYWAEALGSEGADRDKDGSVTAQEAYDFALRKVAEGFKSDAAVLTEHARLAGGEAGQFVVARLGATAMFESDAQLIAMRGEQEQMEQRLTTLRARKAELPEDDYYTQLEPVLLSLARLGVRIDARLAALGARAGDRN
jgi:hypothetical protein